MMEEKRGLFVVIEGGDRSGKSTLARSLAATLGQSTYLGAFPDRTTPIGQVINTHLKGANNLSREAIHLLFSANRHESVEKLRNLLNTGKIVILDRYVPSGIAYSVAKGLDLDWCQSADRGLPKPDFVLYVDLPLELAAARAGFGEEVYERREFQQNVRNAFSLLRKQAEEIGDCWVVIDGSKTQEEMLQDALIAVNNKISSINEALSIY